MMVLPSLLVFLTMETYWQELWRTLSLVMLIKVVFMSKEGSGGTLMVYPLSMKLTRLWESRDHKMWRRWVLKHTTQSVVRLSWGMHPSGSSLSDVWADGLTLKMTTRLCILRSWKVSGGSSDSCLTRDWFIEEWRSCLIQPNVRLLCLTLSLDWTTKKWRTRQSLFPCLLTRNQRLQSLSGQQLPGHYLLIWLFVSTQIWITSKSRTTRQEMCTSWWRLDWVLCLGSQRNILSWTSLKESLWRTKLTNLSSLTLSHGNKNEEPSASWLTPTSQKMQEQEQFIRHHTLEKMITGSVWLLESSKKMVPWFVLLTPLETLLQKSLISLESMSRMQTKTSSSCWRQIRGWLMLRQSNIRIPSVGGRILLWFTGQSPHGLFEWNKCNNNFWTVMQPHTGSLTLLKRIALETGYEKPGIGLFRGTDTGGLQFPSGFLMMERKWFVWDPFKSWRSCQEWKQLTYIER